MLEPRAIDCDGGAAVNVKSIALIVRFTDVPWLSAPLTAEMDNVEVPAAVEGSVSMVSVDVPEPPVMVAGLNVAVAPDGSPETDNAVSPVNPFTAVTVTV